MKPKQEIPKGMIFYPIQVAELLHIRREFHKGVPLFTVFKIEAQNYKYGKKAYCHIIEKQIEDVLKFTLIHEKETLPQYYNPSFGEGVEIKHTEIEPNYNHVSYYYNHEGEPKILIELLEYLQNELNTLPPQPVVYGLKGDPDNDDKMLGFIFRELQKDNWFNGSESHFVAIFRPEPLPVGWKPIEYINNGKPPTISALGTLIKELAPEVGYATIWNGYFTHEGKEIDIPTNNRDSKKVKQKLKGIKTKAKI